MSTLTTVAATSAPAAYNRPLLDEGAKAGISVGAIVGGGCIFALILEYILVRLHRRKRELGAPAGTNTECILPDGLQIKSYLQELPAPNVRCELQSQQHYVELGLDGAVHEIGARR